MQDYKVPTRVRLGQILRKDAQSEAITGRTIAACRAALSDAETTPRAREEIRRYLDELLAQRE